MIIFQPTRTRRLAVKLRELTLGQSIGLCSLPANRHELTATEMLSFVATAERPSDAHLTDPRLWSVEERALLIAKYLAQVCDDGPDFSIGDGRLSDYLMLDRDLPAQRIELPGLVAGKACAMVPLVGAAAQVLETLCETRGQWFIGAIACQILVAGEEAPDWASMSDADGMAWVAGRMERLRALPESDFSAIYAAYLDGAERLAHFFHVDFDDAGIIMQPVEKEGAAQLGPVRFHAASCVSDLARLLS